MAVGCCVDVLDWDVGGRTGEEKCVRIDAFKLCCIGQVGVEDSDGGSRCVDTTTGEGLAEVMIWSAPHELL